MKKVHTDEQIVGIMGGYEGSGRTVKEYCREKGGWTTAVATTLSSDKH